MNDLKLINVDNNVEINLDGGYWEEILILSYKRKRESLFRVLKSKTEMLEQKDFRMKRVNYNEKSYKK